MRAPETHPCAYPDFAPKARCGYVELAVATAARRSEPRPNRVSSLLVEAFDTIDGQRPERNFVERLASGTREWLVQRAASNYSLRPRWFCTDCKTCGAPFDVDLGVEEPEPAAVRAPFPVTCVETGLGERSFEVPNGRHEVAIWGSHDPIRALVGACGLDETAGEDAERYREADLEGIDAALQEISPDVAASAVGRGPE